jgi:hypothetical protein
MSTTRDPDQVLRAWLDLMPDEAPDRAIAAVLQATEHAPQVRRAFRPASWRFPAMNRFLPAIAVVAIAVVAVGVYALTQNPVVGPAAPTAKPSPGQTTSESTSTAASTSPAAQLPAAIQGSWFGSPRAATGLNATAGVVLQVRATSLAVSESTNQGFTPLTFTAGENAGKIRVETGTARTGTCVAGQVGMYSYALSPSGLTMTLSADIDQCAERASVISGSWWLMHCVSPAPASCEGDMDPGERGSQYFASFVAASDVWAPRYGALRYTVPAGWANTGDWPNAFSLAPSADYAAATDGNDPAAEILVVANAMAQSQATPCSGVADASVKPGAAAFVAWLRTLPALHVSSASTMTVDGQHATVIDLTMPAPPPALCDGTDPVIAYLFSPGWRTNSPQDHAVAQGSQDRLILLDGPSGDLIAIVLSVNDASRFEAFSQQAAPIIDSFRFTDASPTAP